MYDLDINLFSVMRGRMVKFRESIHEKVSLSIVAHQSTFMALANQNVFRFIAQS